MSPGSSHSAVQLQWQSVPLWSTLEIPGNENLTDSAWVRWSNKLWLRHVYGGRWCDALSHRHATSPHSRYKGCSWKTVDGCYPRRSPSGIKKYNKIIKDHHTLRVGVKWLRKSVWWTLCIWARKRLFSYWTLNLSVTSTLQNRQKQGCFSEKWNVVTSTESESEYWKWKMQGYSSSDQK